MLKKTALAVALVLGALAVFIATRPAAYRVSRSAEVKAAPARVYARVADFHGWKAWSPWEKLDPKMQTAYSGTDGAPGASYAWKGNDSVGEGRMTLVEARPAQGLAIKLEFLKPFASAALSRFDFAPRPGGTLVTWTMEGNNDFVGKAFSLVMNMDKMVGGDFERGLAQLKAVAEESVASPLDPVAGSAAR